MNSRTTLTGDDVTVLAEIIEDASKNNYPNPEFFLR